MYIKTKEVLTPEFEITKTRIDINSILKVSNIPFNKHSIYFILCNNMLSIITKNNSLIIINT